MIRPVVSDVDLAMMKRCINLSKGAGSDGEFPFVSLICNKNGVITEVTNRVNRDQDVTRHAELIAVSEAQRLLGRHDLSDCTIYSNIEPCAMCSFPIRETRIAKVVYAIQSPLMGGFSKFGVLQDSKMSEMMPEFFGEPPEVIGGYWYTKPKRSGVTATRFFGA
jgi:tRNA(adenine34) deaminase